ncbi:oocyte zinc finger protein XlCOF6 [Echinococcus multilocularis]|uniref:Oocyte zinc finger protein XlCOF6 n=1 Tax=Echinococcus multilocularis TaxID=6211 RepID=A0A087VWL5_ECHMU|nr:oocyte zinc finger protein XlCOF6 [Echinococcus multilocularis]
MTSAVSTMSAFQSPTEVKACPQFEGPNVSDLEQSQSSNNFLHQNSQSKSLASFTCGICGKEFGLRCRLVAHIRRHTGERPFSCTECGRAFSDAGNLQRHRYVHSSEPRFHCTVCGKSFRQASCLSTHRRFHCPGAEGRVCVFCRRNFKSSASLQMHLRFKHRADAEAVVAVAVGSITSETMNSSGKEV